MFEGEALKDNFGARRSYIEGAPFPLFISSQRYSLVLLATS